MSQVVVNNDHFKSKRQKSLAQEQNIIKNSWVTKWQLSDVTKVTLLEKALGLLAIPFILIWAFMLFLLTIVVMIFTKFCALFSSTKI